MPELHDVEHFRRLFQEHAAGKRLVGLTVVDPGLLRDVTAGELERALVGRTFATPARHGKWLIAPTEGGPVLLLHFGMTGELLWAPSDGAPERHDRVLFRFDHGVLRFRNVRRFGRVRLVRDEAELCAFLSAFGPDALGITRREFHARLFGRRGALKATLLDQEFLAGIGNVIADEALWQARLHPLVRVDALTGTERDRLFEALQRVLRQWVAHYGQDLSRWLTHVRGRPDATCPRCGRPIARVRVAGRTTYLCERCQSPPRALAA